MRLTDPLAITCALFCFPWNLRFRCHLFISIQPTRSQSSKVCPYPSYRYLYLTLNKVILNWEDCYLHESRQISKGFLKLCLMLRGSRSRACILRQKEWRHWGSCRNLAGRGRMHPWREVAFRRKSPRMAEQITRSIPSEYPSPGTRLYSPTTDGIAFLFAAWKLRVLEMTNSMDRRCSKLPEQKGPYWTAWYPCLWLWILWRSQDQRDTDRHLPIVGWCFV